jgi:hypothetical protein
MGDAYGGRGMGGRAHRGGFKRRREEESPVDPIRILLANLMGIGDDAMPVSFYLNSSSPLAKSYQKKKDTYNRNFLFTFLNFPTETRGEQRTCVICRQKHKAGIKDQPAYCPLHAHQLCSPAPSQGTYL